MTAVWDYDEAFSRHAGIISKEEQEKLRDSRVAIVGMGGVGGLHLVTLGRLGIGKFAIADMDTFEIANFNRQFGAQMRHVGQPKAKVMAEEVRQINPEVELRIFDQGVTDDNLADFFEGVDIFVDGIDFFSIGMRRKLFRQAACQGIYATTAGPLGFSTAWLTFDPSGMTFDEYFDLNDDQSELEQLIAFAAGLSPDGLHAPYFDWEQLDLGERRGPSTGFACQLCAGVAAAETLKILLQRGTVRTVPWFSQFDAYRGMFCQRQLRDGNRSPEQRAKRELLCERLAGQI